LKDPVEVKIAISRPPETIMQTAYICEDAQKNGIIRHLFTDKTPNKVILFSGSKLKVKELTRTLRKMGLSVGEMHSDLEQRERDAIMHEFKNNRVNMLIATDIVSRGIDIDDITLVINYDVPYEVEDYVHRIGRTARAGDEGMSITLVAPEEQYRFKQIEDFLEKEIYKIPIPEELGVAPEYNPAAYRRKKRTAGDRMKKNFRNRRSGDSKRPRNRRQNK
jgi:superfamily II DNA/RNA helicase